MKKIEITTGCKKMLADIFTPVSIYLRLRDRFRDTVLLESTDHHAAENSYSFICINAIAGIEIRSKEQVEFKLPGQNPEKISLDNDQPVATLLWDFMQRFSVRKGEQKEAGFAQGLYGYTSYDAVRFFETIRPEERISSFTIPLVRYRLYQYVISINHFRD